MDVLLTETPDDAPAELKALKKQRARREREAEASSMADFCARAAADDEYARGRGFRDASAYRCARLCETLPCGHMA